MFYKQKTKYCSLFKYAVKYSPQIWELFMAVRRFDTGKWGCECNSAGCTELRVRKQFATKGEALAFERHAMKETEAKPWLGELVDRRTLKDALNYGSKLHCNSLTELPLFIQTLLRYSCGNRTSALCSSLS